MTPPSTDHLLGAGAPDALVVTEAAREAQWHAPSLIAELFLGRLRRDLFVPFPEQDPEDRRLGDAFLATLEEFLKASVDPDEIDRSGEMPPAVIQGLARLGCFGMKIPRAYGGLGLSQTNYSRAIMLLGSYCGSTTVWLSAHQSIGAPQPLMLFGTEEQKRRYLPKLAQGVISAFALTEPGVGSDPANMLTTAIPIERGESYLLNGEKLWCTNGPVAEVLVVMAKTPPVIVRGKERTQITAFIVERSMPGFEVVHRCGFMGLRGIQNGVIRFTNVRVPKSNLLAGPGLGLKLALTTLNAGRIAIPAACVGTAKRCLQIVRPWAKTRVQWGGPIGTHEAVAVKIGEMAATTFAMDAMVELTAALVDGKKTDIRLEAALAKLFCSEACWRLVDDAMQIRGGRGYETAQSLKARGESPDPVERILRDTRINLIIEGTSQIMRLFIAREALDAHLRRVGACLDPRQPLMARARAAVAAAWFYARWYPAQWCPIRRWRMGWDIRLSRHMAFVTRMSHVLARELFHGAVRHQTRLAERQQLLGRLVDVGGELFAMAAVCAKAQARLSQAPADQHPVTLADLFCRSATRRIRHTFGALHRNDDRAAFHVAQDVLNDRYVWLETGIVTSSCPR